MAITYIQPAIVNASASYTFASVNATSSITVSGGTVVASVLITAIGYPGDDTAADTAGGQTITLTGSGFAAGASVIINGSAVGVVSVVSSTTITFTSPAQSTGSYPLYVVNTNGSTGIAVPGIQYSGTPTWTTAAGSLGSYTETVAIANTVTATGDAPITYSLYSGSLPTGATLNTSNGYISGTSPLEASPTTFTFTIRATDAQAQDTDRQFSLTINPDVVTWSSPANGTTYSSTANSAISNVTMSASAASGQSITYTAYALPTGLSISGSNIYGTPTVAANSSSLLTATAATTNKTATRTINWVISVASDTYFPYVSLLLSANTPSSTFNADASTNNFAITVNGDTRPNNLNPYTPGYYSNYFNGTTAYLRYTTNTNSAFNFGTNNFTLEAWVYPTVVSGTYSIINQSQTNASAGFVLDMYINSGTAGLRHASGSSYTLSITGGTINAYQWCHIAATRSTNTWTLWVNGVSVATGTDSTSVVQDSSGANAGGINVGVGFVSSASTAGYFFTGYISNARVVNGTALYTTTFTPNTSPLTAVANTSLLTCQSNRFIDNSTNNFTLSAVGSLQVSGFIPYTPNSSYSTYGSGYFDGTGDYLATPSSSVFDISGASTFTVECWVYFNAMPAGLLGLVASFNGGTGGSFFLGVSSTVMNVRTGNDASVVSGSTTLTVGRWYHLALVRDGTSSMKGYLNGALEVSSGSFNWTASTQACYIGTYSGGTYQLNGYMSDVRYVLGTAVYTTAFTPPTSPLTAIANTQLLTLQNNQPNTNNMFVDNSTNNLLITRTANSTQGSVTPYAGTYSIYLDGTGDYLTSASNASLGFGTGDFTIEFWAYAISFPGAYNTFFEMTSYTTGIMMRYQATSDSLYIAGNAGDWNPTANFPLRQWNHVALTRSSTSLKVFVNGTSVFSATNSSDVGSSNNMRIGDSQFATGYTWPGYISNFRAVKGTAVYTSNFTPPTAPLAPVTGTGLLVCQSNRFIDNSIANLALTVSGNTAINKFSPFTVQTATVPTSYSAYFDGSGDYLTLPSSSAFTFGTGDFTIEGWVYIIAGGDKGIFQQGTSSFPASVTNSVALGITNSSIWQIYAKNAQNNSAATYAVNTWYHFALVRSSSTTTLYVNGTSIITVASDTTNYTGTYFGIGSIYGTSTTNINAYISNLRVVNGTAVYTTTFTPPTSPLTAIANTSLLTLQSTTFIDNSTNNFTITAYGDSKPTIQNPFGYTNPSAAVYTASSYGGSMYFDGTGDYITVANIPNLSSTQNWVVEAWVYPTYLTPSSYNRFVGGGDFNLGQYAGTWYLTNNSAGLLSAGSVAVNAWTHVAVVNKVGTGSYICINGVIASAVGSALSFTMGNTKVGADVNGVSNWYGYVSDFRVINNSTSSVYAANFVPPLAPLTAVQNVTTLVSGASAGIYDSSMINEFESVGNTQISTAVKKYGNASMYFDGTGDYLQTTTAPNLQLNTGNFTIECWSYLTARVNGYPAIFSNYNSFTTGTLALFAGHASSTTTQYQLAINGSFPAVNAGTIVYNSWVHLAVVRSGSTITLYVNGTSVGTASSSASLNGVGSNFYIGTTGDGLSGGCIQGYLDDFRVTLGIARYTSNFTPSSTPFIQK